MILAVYLAGVVFSWLVLMYEWGACECWQDVAIGAAFSAAVAAVWPVFAGVKLAHWFWTQCVV